MNEIAPATKNEYNPAMAVRKNQISDQVITSGIGYLAILAIAILGIQLLEPGVKRMIGMVLFASFTILFALFPSRERPAWQGHLFLALMTAIVVCLMSMDVNWGVFPMLFFVLSPTAIMAFPGRPGLIWLIIFSLVTAITLVIITTPLNAVMLSLPFSAGYGFFGAFARALANAEEARNESQRLLTELRAAHEQLQDYAARIEQLAISEERNRLAREMHDTLGHRLTVAAVQLEGAQRLIERDPGRAAGMVETVRAQVREALAELRATVATMREPFEAELSLVVSLKRLAESFDQATDLKVHLDLPTELCPLPNAYRLAFYRATQEALTNVQRHAQAQNVWISLSQAGDQIALQVSDDGAGFLDETKETAFGLRGMRERISHLGGTLSIANRAEGGAQLRIQLPKPEEQSDEKD